MTREAIILAGGFGTRLKSVVSDVPKPMAPINGKPFLEYQLNYLISQGFTLINLAVGYKYQVISQYFGCHFNGADLIYSVEKIPLGTGGALINILKNERKKQPIIVLNGDTFFPIDINQLEYKCQADNADWGIALFRSSNLERYATVNLDKNGKVLSIKENQKKTESLVNGGIYWLNPLKTFPPEYLETYVKNTYISLEDQILPFAINKNQNVFGYEFDNFFIDIGIPVDYMRASDVINLNT
jgi:D-glycero-alpha-D-manno-heptose 1-phosphate guanylyltransferase